MTDRSLIAMCAAACLCLLGCVATTKGRVVDLYRETGLQRASFDLRCPAAEISAQALSAPAERDYRLIRGERPFPMRGDTVGVRGCGREAVYIYDQGHGWINNTGGDQGPR